MKRFICVLAIGLFVVSPIPAQAATIHAGEQYSLATQKAVSGNLYVAAGTTTLGGRITGDVFAVGGTITVSGSVGGDVVAAGGTIQVLGPVDGDVRVLGGTSTINDRVGGDLVVLGGTIHVLPGAIISGDMIIAGGQVLIDGAVYGNLTYSGGSLTINGSVRGDVSAKLKERFEVGPAAMVSGAVSYRAPSEMVLADGGRILGEISYEPRGRAGRNVEVPREVFWAVLGAMTGMRLLAVLGLVALLVWRWRRQVLEVFASARAGFWVSLGHGLAYSILVPIASILLLISFVGILPGALLILLFVGALILTKALTGMLLGSWLAMVFKKRETLHISWGSAFGGVILLEILGLVPVLGWIVCAALWLAVFGALGQRIQQHLSR
jgi:cytoskeletal protein CcmA (bactofilin family)